MNRIKYGYNEVRDYCWVRLNLSGSGQPYTMTLTCLLMNPERLRLMLKGIIEQYSLDLTDEQVEELLSNE